MESELNRVTEIFNKMPKFDWKEAEHVGVSFFFNYHISYPSKQWKVHKIYWTQSMTGFGLVVTYNIKTSLTDIIKQKCIDTFMFIVYNILFRASKTDSRQG